MSKAVTDALTRKLSATTKLDSDDIAAIEALPIDVRSLPARQVIVHDGECPNSCCLVIEGFTFRSKTTIAGKRQILSIHVPGDIPDLQSLYLEKMDHDFSTLNEATVGFISHASLRGLLRQRIRIGEALWRETLIDAAIFREWIVNVGQRPGPVRLAHLLLEMKQRLAVIGGVNGASFELPMNQQELADALGITAVHVSRVMKELRERGLVDFQRHLVVIRDEQRLRELGDFDPIYLHENSGP
jgi:CRP-like cAMP-binding protein